MTDETSGSSSGKGEAVRPTVFISYSHKDEVWKDRLLPHLKALEQAGLVAVWDDRRIDPGGKWYPEILETMAQAGVAVCLISPDYLASEFCLKEEIPYLFERRESEGMALILVLLRPCAWEAFPWIKETQMLPRDGKSVTEDFQGREDQVFSELAQHIYRIIPEPALADHRPDTVPYHSDDPAVHDELGRRDVAYVLWQLIREVWQSKIKQRNLDKASPAPQRVDPQSTNWAFMIHIHGPWGAGKSSLLNFLRDIMRELGPQDRWIVVQFNAWQHQRVGAPWWSLMNEVYGQAVQQLSSINCLRALNLRRWENLWRLKGQWGPSMIAFAILLWIVSLALLGTDDGNRVTSTIQNFVGVFPLKQTIQITASLIAIGGGVLSISRNVLPGSARAARTFFEVSRDPMHPLTRHYENLINRINQPVAVFIDDLDRCDSAYVVDLLQSIQTLFCNTQVMYIVAADRKWLCSSYEQVYETFAETIYEPGRPLGYLFLEKIFQLSVSVPRLSTGIQRRYWLDLLNSDRPRQHKPQADQRKWARQELAGLSEAEIIARLRNLTKSPLDSLLEKALREAAVERLADSELIKETEHFLLQFAHLVSPNPRDMKRLLNAYRFQRDVRIMSGQTMDREHMALWTIAELRWPILADFLASRPEMVDQIGKPNIPEEVPERVKPLMQDSIVQDVFNGKTPPLDAEAVRICVGLKSVIVPEYRPPAPPPPRWSLPDKVDIDRLPSTGAELFGRQEELVLLEGAWEAEGTNLVSLVAWGGVGKSTLVNKWLERMAADNYRGARRVFGWSFYSQGTGERVTSADQFIAAALEWFGDDNPTQGSTWDKGQRLADLVREEPTLLVLDGLEPLQSDLEIERGKIKDPALTILVSELARENAGLCVISTREAVADLAPFRATTREMNLEQISDEAGRALLRVGGVRGTDAELEAATRDFGNHALALNLVAAYLRGIPGHHISHAAEIPDLDILDEKGRHPRRLMAAFAKPFGEGPEVELLRMLGLFDRPAEAEAIAAVRTAPAIPNLTANLLELPEGEWRDLLGKLRRTGLMAPESEHRPDTLDAHPLVREHFGQQLREDHPDAWREGNDRLYEHYKQVPEKELPDTIEEMAPLFAAVAHGCAAGRHQEAFDEVYWRRIQRGEEAFSMRNLGTIDAELAALSGFFDSPWKQPVATLAKNTKGFVLNKAGFDLRALGRLAEAAEPMQAGLDADIAREDWKNAASAAGNLSELHLAMGDLTQTLEIAQQRVDLTDKSGDAFQGMASRTSLADALHQAGRVAEAETLFGEAEAMQKENQPEYPLLFSLRGFHYCDLLLGQGKFRDVRKRAGQTIEIARRSHWLLDIALDNLSLGRAHLAKTQQEERGDFSKAAEYLDHAIDGLRQAGQQDYIPRGLLARAALHRVRGDFERARRDLDEAMTIAERGGMGLHQADAHLEYARLYLAMGDEPEAREHLATATEMIGRMGYRRRDGEVAELEERLDAG